MLIKLGEKGILYSTSEADKSRQSFSQVGSPGYVVFFQPGTQALCKQRRVYFLNERVWSATSFMKLAYIQFVYFYVGFLCRAVQRNSHENHQMTVATASAFLWNSNVEIVG